MNELPTFWPTVAFWAALGAFGGVIMFRFGSVVEMIAAAIITGTAFAATDAFLWFIAGA